MNRYRHWLVLITLVFALALVYGMSLTHQFAYDDAILIIHNPAVTQSEHSFQEMVEIFKEPTPPGNLYRPLTIFSFSLNHLWSGLNPQPYHLVNLLLHLGTAFLLYLLTLRFFGNFKVAILSSLLFLVHPALTEAVANISGRSELLSAFFGIGSILLLTAPKGSQVELLLGACSLTLAGLSKESALVVLGLILIMPKESGADSNQRFFRKHAALLTAFLACLASLFLRWLALGSHFLFTGQGAVKLAENPILHLSFLERLVPALKILGDYIFLILAPFQQSADYSMMPEVFLPKIYTLCGVASVALVASYCLLIWALRSRQYAVFGLWFLIAFALTSNILFPIGTIMGERLLYLPAAGLITFVVTATSATQLNQNLKLFAAGAAVLACALLTLKRLPVWQNNDTLFRQMVIEAPMSPKSHYNLGVHLYLHTKDLAGAEREFKRTLELFPHHIFALRTLADIALKRGDKEQLKYWYLRLLDVTPDDEQVRENLRKL